MNQIRTNRVSGCRRAIAAKLRVGLALLALGTLAGRLEAQDKSFLWKIQSKKSYIYVLGSIHYLKQENYPLKTSIRSAFDDSATLVLEIDPYAAAPEKLQQVILQKALYPDGTLLRQNIAPETYDSVERRAGTLGIQIDQLDRFKPWFVAFSIMSAKLEKMGFDPNYGLDRYLAGQAKGGGKRIRGLESLEFQIGALDGLQAADQEQMLRQTLSELDAIDENLAELVKSWASGDAAGLERLLLAGMKNYPGVYEKLIVERNQRWLPQLVDALERGEKTLVVVGAGHLVGKQGVIELLKQRGFTVEQR